MRRQAHQLLRNHGDDGALGQGSPIEHDLAFHDGAGDDLHVGMVLRSAGRRQQVLSTNAKRLSADEQPRSLDIFEAIGFIGERLVLLFTLRDQNVHVVSLKRANERERNGYAAESKP